MSNFAVIFCYRVDSQGEYRDDDDMLGVLTIEEHHTPESLSVTEGLVDRVFDDLDAGTHVKFELFNVTFSGVTNETNEVLMARIKDDMENMIKNGELTYVNDHEFFATVEK